MMYVVLGHDMESGKLVSRMFRSRQNWVSAENSLIDYMRRRDGWEPAHWEIDYNESEDIAVTRHGGIEYMCMPLRGGRA